MPRSCPACGRPNADRATECLYCRHSPDAGSTAPQAMEPRAAPIVSASKRHLIILAPGDEEALSEARVSALARELEVTLYDARRLLQANRHRLFKRVEGVEAARQVSERLRAVGVDHFLIAEADVEALAVVRVRWLQMEPGQLRLGVDALHQRTLCIPYEEILLLVRGEIARERHNERKMTTPRGASRALSPGLRLHLYGVETDLAPEIDAEQIDWGVVGDPPTTSTPMNLKRLVERILSRAQKAELDRGFDFESVVLSHGEDPSSVEAMLKGPRSPEGAIYDNVAQFRFYARWRYLVARSELLQRRSSA